MAFKLKDGNAQVFLPGVGRVRPGVTLMGEQYRRFADQGLLVEVPDPPPKPALEAPKPSAKPMVEIPPPPRVPLESQEKEPEGELLTEKTPLVRRSSKKTSRRRK